MAATRILIITNGALCRNPRVVKEATTLGAAGYAVTVLTVRNHAASEVHDLALLRTAPFQRVVVDQLQSGPAQFLRRLETWLARKATTALRWETPRALGPTAALLQRARELPATLTIVHNEPAHYVGTRLMRAGRRVAADLEDWHSEDLLPPDRAGRPLHLLREIERTLLHRCAYTSTTSHALADALHARYGGRRPAVISNSFPLQPAPSRPPSDAPPTFFWFSQTLGPGRGLEPFFAAWAQLKHPNRVVLLGEARGDFIPHLLSPLPPPLRARVTVLPLVAPDQLPAVIARHDIGLALEQAFIVNRNLTVTNKILQYLNAGLAVVASDTAGQREVLAANPDAGVLVSLEQTSAFAAVLDDLLSDRAALARRQHAARRLAEDVYCWERTAPQLLELAAAACSERGDRTPAP